MRLKNLRQKMTTDSLAGMLITQPENRRYLSGFTGSNGVLIITAERRAVATDSRYYEQVRQQCPDWELLQVGYDFVGALPEVLQEFNLDGQNVGFEAGHISVSEFRRWEQAAQNNTGLLPTDGFVEAIRMQKDASELASLKKAIALADDAWTHISGWMNPGMTELEVAWELEVFMRTHGAAALSFESIVASGPNSAKPHARPSERVIQPGEPITLDFGCVVDGYCSDITRTVCLGNPADERYLTVWNTVLAAQQAALDGVAGGISGAEVDKLARDVIKSAGYGEYFGHGLGHGLGLAVHESPRFSFSYAGTVPAGTVMTIEPGIYLPEWGGVRLEDVVLVTAEGAQVLTTAPKQPILA